LKTTIAGTEASPTTITGGSSPTLDEINGGTLVVYGSNNTSGIRFGFSAASYTKDFECDIIFPGANTPTSTSGNSGRFLHFSATPYNAAVTYTCLTTGVGSGGGYKFEQKTQAGGLTYEPAWTVVSNENTGQYLEAGGILKIRYSYNDNIIAFHSYPAR